MLPDEPSLSLPSCDQPLPRRRILTTSSDSSSNSVPSDVMVTITTPDRIITTTASQQQHRRKVPELRAQLSEPGQQHSCCYDSSSTNNYNLGVSSGAISPAPISSSSSGGGTGSGRCSIDSAARRRSLSDYAGHEHFSVSYVKPSTPTSPLQYTTAIVNSSSPLSNRIIEPTTPDACSVATPSSSSSGKMSLMELFAHSWPLKSTAVDGIRHQSRPTAVDTSTGTIQLQQQQHVSNSLIGQSTSKTTKSKCVLTVDQDTTEILIANDKIEQLFAIQNRNSLIGRRLTQVFSDDYDRPPAILDKLFFPSDITGGLEPIYGKAIDIVDLDNHLHTVSIWSYSLVSSPIKSQHTSRKQSSNQMTPTTTTICRPASYTFTHEQVLRLRADTAALDSARWLILMEPIDALNISCTLGAKGRIFRADDSLADLIGVKCITSLLGSQLVALIPTLQLEANDGRIQHVCIIGARGNAIPITVKVIADYDSRSGEISMYNVSIRALSTINGLLTVSNNGILCNYNENFLSALLGHSVDENLKKRHITTILPDIYENIADQSTSSDVIAADLPDVVANAASNDRSMINDLSTVSNVPSVYPNRSSSLVRHLNFGTLSLLEEATEPSPTHSTATDDEYDDDDRIRLKKEQIFIVNGADRLLPTDDEMANIKKNSISTAIQEGTYYGFAKHVDNSLIAVRYDIRQLDSKNNQLQWAIWIEYDRTNDFGLINPLTSTATVTSPAVVTSNNVSADDDTNSCDLMFAASERRLSIEDGRSEALYGEYSDRYDTFEQIGTGSFGSVKLAANKKTGLLAVVKFICKSKVLPDCWVMSEKRDRVPIEVHLLETLSHPHIVKVLDVFENATYYQLVMEKLGCGMDLFEFIEYQPKMDEPLISFIFRQVVSAVSYLHSRNIVHRDLKDENVIIDHRFCCKLIDFGSAAYFGRGVLFSTFCGTMEYCSPEVLTGNKYAGPELEMWSLGILLYTLVYFENPFRTAEETVNAELDELPWDVSEGLFQVISWLLQPDPELRATVVEIQDHWWTMQLVDINKYKFQEILNHCDRAQIDPPLYVTDLSHHYQSVLDDNGAY